MRRLISRLGRDKAGAAIVEFALLAPAIIGMMLGVLQVGRAMQNYNALRNVSADVERYAMVQYATGNQLTNAQLRNYAISTAVSTPYLLQSSSISATVTDAATQRVSGVTEKTLTIDYQILGLFDEMGLRGPYITYTRPLFLTTSAS